MIDWLVQQPWTGAAVFALAAVAVASVLHRLLRSLVRRLASGHLLMQGVVNATERAAALVLPLLALQMVWQAAPDSLPGIGGVRHLNALALIGAITWYLSAFIEGLAEGVIARHPATVEDNLRARSIQTQTRVLARSAEVGLVIAGVSLALMTFPGARQVGASLLASAGVLGIVGGLAARPVFSNLIAGLQIALAQPIRLDDVLIVKGEWGRVEEITGTYVVLKIWDERRLIIPLQWFIENPFENWTRSSASILGTAFLWLDYATPVAEVREVARRITEAAPEWDRRVFTVAVTDTTERAMQVRILVSARNSGDAFELRCKLREGVLAHLAAHRPESLPRFRMEPPAGPPLPAQ